MESLKYTTASEPACCVWLVAFARSERRWPTQPTNNLLGPPAVRQDNLAIMLDGYFQKNGHHINVNVLSRETLLDAMERPHLYPQPGHCAKEGFAPFQ